MPPDFARTATERLCHHLAHLPANAPLDPATLAAAAQTTPAHAAQLLAALAEERILAHTPRLLVHDSDALTRIAALVPAWPQPPHALTTAAQPSTRSRFSR